MNKACYLTTCPEEDSYNQTVIVSVKNLFVLAKSGSHFQIFESNIYMNFQVEGGDFFQT
jgi:hypothetical protein